MKRPETIETEVLTRVSTDTLVSTDSTAFTEADHARALISDLNHIEVTTRSTAFVALRVGMRLMWLSDAAPYGSLASFIKRNLEGRSERTLFRYIKMAKSFVIDAGLCDKKTHKLTDGERIAPILNEQLELFTDPQAKLEGALAKVVKWVGKRGLSEIYRSLGEADKPGYTRRDETGKIVAGKGKPKTAEQLAAQATEEITDVLTLLDTWFKARHHTRVSKGMRSQAAAIFEEAIQKLNKVAD